MASMTQNVRQQGNAAGAVGAASTNQNYQLVVDPRLGIIVGTMTPTVTTVTAQPTQVQPVTTVSPSPVSRRGGRRGRGSGGYTPATPPATIQKVNKQFYWLIWNFKGCSDCINTFGWDP